MRALITAHGGTQALFAEKVGDESHTGAQRWAQGYMPAGPALARIAAKTGCSLDWLISGGKPADDGTVQYRGQGAGNIHLDLAIELRRGAAPYLQDLLSRLTINVPAVIAVGRAALEDEARRWNAAAAIQRVARVPGELSHLSRDDGARFTERGDHLKVLERRAPEEAADFRRRVRRDGRLLTS